MQQTQIVTAIKNLSTNDLHTTLAKSHSALNLTTPPHLSVPISLLAVPNPIRRPVKGAHSASAMRRTLDRPHQAPPTLEKLQHQHKPECAMLHTLWSIFTG
jgi:hypothetical protein